jgi:hypothetical protein
MDGLAKSSTELGDRGWGKTLHFKRALDRLKTDKLVKVQVQGRHRYYLAGPNVARAMERLSVLAGDVRPQVRT